MNDNQIIKALECCAQKNCKACPCNDTKDCASFDASVVLDLINRQKAEIERLQEVISKMETTKAEAIKEFAERLKERVYSQAVRIKIDWLVEETEAEYEKEKEPAHQS